MPTTSVSPYLRTYLQDHHAGATVGTELARRAASANEGSEYGAELSAIAGEIAEDREALERLMAAVEVKANPIKDGIGWTAEKLGRLKPNNSLLSYSPLSRVVELEGLLIGVTGKLALWEATRDVLGPQFAGVDFATLIARAETQRARLGELRRAAAAEAFAGE